MPDIYISVFDKELDCLEEIWVDEYSNKKDAVLQKLMNTEISSLYIGDFNYVDTIVGDFEELELFLENGNNLANSEEFRFKKETFIDKWATDLTEVVPNYYIGLTIK